MYPTIKPQLKQIQKQRMRMQGIQKIIKKKKLAKGKKMKQNEKY